MASPLSTLLQQTRAYLTEHPEALYRAARDLVSLRASLPIELLQSVLGELAGAQGVTDVTLTAAPPGVRFGATIDLMGNVVRATGRLVISRILLGTSEARVQVSIDEVALELLKEAPGSPVPTLIKSGALDLRRPGNLVAYMPSRPSFLVEAEEDRVTVDLLQIPAVANQPRLKQWMSLGFGCLSVGSVDADSTHLVFQLQGLPEGFAGLQRGWGAVAGHRE